MKAFRDLSHVDSLILNLKLFQEPAKCFIVSMSASRVLADLAAIIASVSGWFYENFKLQWSCQLMIPDGQ